MEIVNIRDSAHDKHKTVDDTSFGGGSGMIMRADVISNSLDKNISNKNDWDLDKLIDINNSFELNHDNSCKCIALTCNYV